MTKDSHALDPAVDAFYQVAGARRDIRNGFLPDPVDDDVLTRVLAAAHQAPSVGLSQPWDFLILREREVRMSAAAARAGAAGRLRGHPALGAGARLPRAQGRGDPRKPR